MKHIKWDFSLKPASDPLGWAVTKILLFQNMVMLHIKLKGITYAYGSEYLTKRTPLIHGVGSKDQNIFFLKVVMLHIKLKEMEHRAI